MDPVLPLLYDVETPAGQGITVEIYGTVLEQMTVNRLYYFCPEATALTPTQLGQFSASVWNGIGTEWAAAVSDQWGLQEVRSYAHRDYAMMFGTRSAPDLIDTVGTQGGDCEAPYEAYQIRRQTEVAGRHGRGFIRLAGVAESQTVQGDVTPAQVTLLADLAAALIGNRELTQGENTRVFLPYMFTEPRPLLAATTRGKALMQWTVSTVTHTQRSRRYGHGA